MMNNADVLVSIIVGILCAAAGILARPKVPSAENKARTIVAAVSAAVPVVAWIIWIGHPLATSLGFIAATLALGQLRDQSQP